MSLDLTTISSQYINIDKLVSDVSANTEGTIILTATVTTDGTYRALFSVSDTDAATRLHFFIDNNEKLTILAIVAGEIKWVLKADAAIAPGTYKFSVAHNGTEATIYVNNVAVAQTFIANTDRTYWISQLTNVDNARIGSVDVNSGGNSSFYNGAIRYVRYYNRALSIEELQTIYTANGADNIVNGLQGRWLMNENTAGQAATGASSIIDISPNANHGTPVNSPLYVAAPVQLIHAPIVWMPSAAVSVVSTPVISPAAGSHINYVSITMTCATADAKIYYTTDGSTPDATDTEYTAAFTVTASATVKAIGIKAALTDSAVASSAFVITDPEEHVINEIADDIVTALGNIANGSATTPGRYWFNIGLATRDWNDFNSIKPNEFPGAIVYFKGSNPTELNDQMTYQTSLNDSVFSIRGVVKVLPNATAELEKQLLRFKKDVEAAVLASPTRSGLAVFTLFVSDQVYNNEADYTMFFDMDFLIRFQYKYGDPQPLI